MAELADAMKPQGLLSLHFLSRLIGVYLNLVEDLFWVQVVARSNRVTPTNITEGDGSVVGHQLRTLGYRKVRGSTPPFSAMA